MRRGTSGGVLNDPAQLAALIPTSSRSSLRRPALEREGAGPLGLGSLKLAFDFEKVESASPSSRA
jgi:hypothetical protein